VIARKQDFGHTPTLVFGRSGVLRFLEQHSTETLSRNGIWVADNSG